MDEKKKEINTNLMKLFNDAIHVKKENIKRTYAKLNTETNEYEAVDIYKKVVCFEIEELDRIIDKIIELKVK